ncbi:glycosyl transferase, partial [Arthrospira sp. PCC 8006]
LGGTGKLLPNPNVDPAATARELAHTLEEWAVNPQLRQAMGQASKLRAQQLFREERMLRETINIFQQAISAPISDEFAQGEEVIKGVQNVSHRLRYRSQTWQAWHAYTTGDTAAAVEHLQRSLKYSSFQFTTQTILDWVNDFVRLSSLKGDRLDALSFAKLIMNNY